MRKVITLLDECLTLSHGADLTEHQRQSTDAYLKQVHDELLTIGFEVLRMHVLSILLTDLSVFKRQLLEYTPTEASVRASPYKPPPISKTFAGLPTEDP